MRSLIVLLFLLAGPAVYGQINTAELIGNWKVAEVKVSGSLSAEEKKVMNMVMPIFKKSTYKFDSQGYGKMHMPIGNIPVRASAFPSGDVRWFFNEQQQSLKITERKDFKKILAEMLVKKEDNFYYFMVMETNLVLKMARIQ